MPHAGDLDDHLARARASGPATRLDVDCPGATDDGGLHLTAPMDRPRTSLSWAAKPAMSTGRETSVAAAHSLARNRPSAEMKPTRKIGAVAALVAVRLTAKKNSFQAKMKQISAVAARPGATIGSDDLAQRA